MAADLKNLHPTVRAAAEKLVANANKRLTGPYQMRITQGYRSIAEQNKLYAQGRTKPGKIVTNAKGGTSYHNYGLAIDFCLISRDGKKAIWDISTDFDGDGVADWMEVVQEAKKLGFEWGGDWKSFKDYPHFQMTFGLSIKDLQNGKRPSGSAQPSSPSSGPSATVKEYQGLLVKHGYKIEVDGYDGPATKAAVKDFQKKKGLAVDGIVGSKTLAALNNVPASAPAKSPIVPYPGSPIYKGSKSSTKDIQRIQRAVGVNPDGVFGASTEKAVKAYQSRHGLVSDGVVGKATWNMMF